MSLFICPVCKENLQKDNKSYKCVNNHNFDCSKSGYVNLLRSQQSKDKKHGDDKVMVKARRNFLEKGFYNEFCDSIAEIACKYLNDGETLLDAGCGECFYTYNIKDKLERCNKHCKIAGIDISKNALDIAGKRGDGVERAVASIFEIPCADKSCNMIVNVFAPCCQSEYSRILRDGGILIKAVPLEKHLWSLKKCVYDNTYENEPIEKFLNGYELLEEKILKNTIELPTNEDITNLFMMTPYYYKTGENDFNKLKSVDALNVETEFAILVYKKC